ncbi:hypothetical protein F511_47159 [Dorcoceras hygrometricum]|uniref:Uncharacterized protein n=1 Tax=Dorcoceras hygrometricum TaxID=472368 RepID=A0A2Z6ZRS6_9LAMI|nr:hypothetical protein F511_47159 [Dorcoceras hygrometricum]
MAGRWKRRCVALLVDACCRCGATVARRSDAAGRLVRRARCAVAARRRALPPRSSWWWRRRRPPLRRVSGDVVTAGLFSSRV